MTKEQRRREICEVIKLVDQIAALSHYQIVKVHGIRVVLARLGDISEEVESVEGGGEGLAGGGEFVGKGAET